MKSAIKAHGMMFRRDMIAALLNTQVDAWPAKAIDQDKPIKWQTRRLMKSQPNPEWTELGVESIVHATRGTVQQATYRAFPNGGTARFAICECPHSVGTLIYAKETFALIPEVTYRADDHGQGRDDLPPGVKWLPAIFMPRSDARIWLRVMRVRVERVNAIGESDAIAEGTFGAMEYSILWEKINGEGTWIKNPWVWVYDLAKISKP